MSAEVCVSQLKAGQRVLEDNGYGDTWDVVSDPWRDSKGCYRCRLKSTDNGEEVVFMSNPTEPAYAPELVLLS